MSRLTPVGCQTCHADAVSADRYLNARLSTATNCGPNKHLPCAPLHANGSLDVNPLWYSPPYKCYDCH